MNKKRFFPMLFLVFIFLSLLTLKFAEEIVVFKGHLYTYVMSINEKISSNNKLHGKMDFETAYAEYPRFTSSTDAWHQNTNLIYHAGGGVDGLAYTNSKEALEKSVQNGNVIEIDFLYTADDVLVCVHDWNDIKSDNNPLSLQEFISTKICGKYTPVTGADLVNFMEQNSNVYIVVDTKEDDLVRVVQDLISSSNNQPDIINRFIIQLYDRNQKEQIMSLYPFSDENFLFTCYKFGVDHKAVLTACMEENISVVTVPYGSWDADIIELFTKKGIVLFEHTVNRPDYVIQSQNKGITGFYTDFLTVDSLN